MGNKQNKIVFSETIDKSINGYALGFSFTGIDVFLLVNPNYFFAPIVSYILGAVIGFLGVCGTGIELSKSSKIEGIKNLIFGLALSAIWVVTYLKVHTLWANIVFFSFLVFGAYATCLGLIQGLYSIVNNIKIDALKEKKAQNKGAIISQVVLFLTQICGLIVAVFNVIKAASI